MTKSATRLAGDRQLVTLSMRAATSEPLAVSVTDAVPSTHALHVDDAELPGGDGVISIDQTVGPDETVTIDYRLDGPVDLELPEPTVERVTDPPPDGDASTRAEWVSNDGDTVSLPFSARADTKALDAPGEDVTPADHWLQGVAVGVVLTKDNEDAALRTVLRARHRGHVTFVTSLAGDDESLRALTQLGAVAVSPPSKRASQSDLHRALSQAAREQGATGIVLQTRDCPRIDYGRTATAFERADYEVIAIPESWEQTSGSPTVVVGIPAYNAADSIGPVVERAAAYADEVVVVDDGSRDETAARAREAGATVVTHERNRGYGGALKTLFREAVDREAAHLVVIDADGQHDPTDIPVLVETQTRANVDIVIGSRYVGDRTTDIPLVRSVGLAVINNLTNASLGKLRPSGFIRDTQSGYRSYSLYAARSLASDRSIGNNMGASTDILYHAHRNRLSVSEVETTISYDVENASSQGSISHGLDLLRNIFWVIEYGRPLLILGLPGALITLLGITSTVLLLAQFTQTGVLVPVRLIPPILFAIGGTLLCIAAVMMHVLNGHPAVKRLNSDENS